MAKEYDLHHWDNSRLKTVAIVAVCAMKNDVYLVYEEKEVVATFQLRKKDEVTLLFQKLATFPQLAKKGIGSFCINEIEKIGKTENCQEVVCEVYDKSDNAKNFYFHRGYEQDGIVETRKYNELKLRKKI
jgi:GNAT superfamily N-acetyltransferase